MVIVFIFLVGLCVGSFLNVLIDRLPKGQNVLMGRSHCDFCKKILRWYELIPLLSFVLQAGRCRRCHQKLSLQYPLVELVTGIGFVFFWRALDYPLLTQLSYIVIFSSLLIIFITDLKYQIIPDSMVVAGAMGGLGVIGGIGNIGENTLVGLGAAGFFLLLWGITKRSGMGLGDVKLVFVLGFLLGFPSIIIALYVAFLTGAMVGVILILKGKKSLKAKVPFGPFLIIGFIVAAQWTQQILHLWRNFF